MTHATIISIVPPETSKAVHDVVRDGLRSFNRAHAGDAARAPLVLAATGPQGTTVGGLIGETAWQWLFVDRLWVNASQRGCGIGRELMRHAEVEAIRRGCIGAYLDTFEFQARPFYEKLGYTIFGTLVDFPPGYRRSFLQKRFDPSVGSANER